MPWPMLRKNLNRDRGTKSLIAIGMAMRSCWLHSDSDSDGEALADELSETIAAYAPGNPRYRVRILSVTMMAARSSETGL
jgi:hypothetical protein